MPRSPEELRIRLDRLKPGEIEILSRDAFDAVFSGGDGVETRKNKAIELGESCKSQVLFVGTERMFVRFTRQQDVPPTR
jgi:hypothetical protein